METLVIICCGFYQFPHQKENCTLSEFDLLYRKNTQSTVCYPVLCFLCANLICHHFVLITCRSTDMYKYHNWNLHIICLNKWCWLEICWSSTGLYSCMCAPMALRTLCSVGAIQWYLYWEWLNLKQSVFWQHTHTKTDVIMHEVELIAGL